MYEKRVRSQRCDAHEGLGHSIRAYTTPLQQAFQTPIRDCYWCAHIYYCMNTAPRVRYPTVSSSFVSSKKKREDDICSVFENDLFDVMKGFVIL